MSEAGRSSSPAAFVHLRTHSAFSLAEGAIRIKELPKLVKSHAMPAVGITDTNNLFGALEISEILASAGIQPVIGIGLWVRFPMLKREGGAGQHRQHQEDETRATLPLLAMSEKGFENLTKLSSRSYLGAENGQAPTIEWDELKGLTEGLIALSGGPDGPLNTLVLQGRSDEAKSLAQELEAIFSQRFYVELQRHHTPGEIKAEPALIDIAYDLELPLVATNEPYFPDRSMHEAHDALLCIAEGSYILTEERRRVTPEHYFKSAEEMAALFSDVPEAIDNTIEIARRCRFRPRTTQPVLPRFDGKSAEEVAEGQGPDEAEELRRQAREGLKSRLAENPLYTDEKAYWDRLDYELSVIIGMKFPGYFLIVSDFMKWTRAEGIPVGVRGSGATSIVAWALEITNLDPLRFDLVFERFLNPERVSMPDFDIDFCQERRDEVIDYVRRKYGRDRVAQIITFGKLQARAVVRDVGRVLQMPYGQVDRIAKLVPNNPAAPVTLAEAIDQDPKLQEMANGDPSVAKLLDIGKRLEGLYRHASTHAAGLVIGDRPLEETIPLYRDPRSDMPVTQYSMKWVEPAGLVKFDFLGLKTLTVIARTEKFLEAQGIEVKTDQVPFDDAKAYEMLSRGESVGVFQLESSGMRDLLRKMRPDRIEDLIALVALYRPGPMDSIPRYIACKHGREEVTYLHPTLEPILNETFGVMTYQEDVMQIARDLAGYSLGEADLLRRAMGKKIKEQMDAHRVRFREGSHERGIDGATADAIFDQAAKFAGYGFNKGHAAAYAQVAYQTAYLKANFPVEFIAASMSLDLGQTDKLNVIRQEANRMKVRINPPSINRSEADFSVHDDEIFYALGAIKNVGQGQMQSIVKSRTTDGPFSDVFDFARRMDPKQINRRTFENLVKAGAFDDLNPNRAQLLGSIDLLLGLALRSDTERNSNQHSLFVGTNAPSPSDRLELPEILDLHPMDRLAQELGAVGFYLSGHPLDAYERVLKAERVQSFSSLSQGKERGGQARLAGTVISCQERKSRKSGKPYAFVQLTDQSAQFEVMVFSELLSEKSALLEAGTSVLLDADVQWEDNDPKLFARGLQPLSEAAARSTGGVRIFLDDPSGLQKLERVFTSAEGARSPGKPGPGSALSVHLCLSDRGQEVELQLGSDTRLDPSMVQALRAMPGILEVEELD